MTKYKLIYARYAYLDIEADTLEDAQYIAEDEDIEGFSDCGWYFVDTQECNIEA